MSFRRLTLGKLSLLATLAVVLVICAALAIFVKSSRTSILAKADDLREQAASRVEGMLAGELGRAGSALDDVEGGVRSGAIPITDERALEAALFTRALADPHIEEITFTHATGVGFDASGEALLAREGRWQVSVLRGADGRLTTRVTESGAEGFVVRVRNRAPGGGFDSARLEPVGAAKDPTTHLTFLVLAARDQRGRAAWSDLHYAEADQALPEARRSVVSVQKAIVDRDGQFLGVLRVAILAEQLDALARESIDNDARDPQRIAVMAVSEATNRVSLVSRVHPNDQLVVTDGDLRVVAAPMPPELVALQSSPLVRSLNPDHPMAKGVIDVEGARWQATLRELSIGSGGTRGWFVALLVPEEHYTRDFERDSRQLLVAFGATLALVLVIGALMLASVRRGLGEIVATTTRMRNFDFLPAPHAGSKLADVDLVMKGLERAKTVVRAMAKYIPVDLVHGLYESNHEPELGGVECELSLMFTDLEGFTTLSEKLTPDELARRLGDYLEAMTDAIEKTDGTIDKYIGDAVMSFWNAPTPVPGHAERACSAALACMEAARELYASPSWGGLPPMVTRFGVHTARVLVGHFGAPTRLSYTALGDGVNLAARLEPLCKQYGVISLVSEETVAAAGKGFVFRRIDRVAVKGKTRGIDVFELLGRSGEELSTLPVARRYEEAFDAYLARRFADAVALLETQADHDPPSAVLLGRCRELLSDPPPQGWDGVHVAHAK